MKPVGGFEEEHRRAGCADDERIDRKAERDRGRSGTHVGEEPLGIGGRSVVA